MDNGPGLGQQVPADEVWPGNQTAVTGAGASDAGAGALAAVAGAGAPQIFGMMAIFCLMREMNGDNDEAIKTDEIAREAKAEKLNIHKKMKTENVGGVVNSSSLTVPMMALLAAMLTSLGKSEPVRDGAVCIYEQQVEQPWISPSTLVLILIVFFQMLMLVTVWSLGCLHCPRRRPLMLNKITQSQVQYTWYVAQPRFVPLGEAEHGAWG